MSVDTLTVHTNAAYAPHELTGRSLSSPDYWRAEWPETVRGMAINSDKTIDQVTQELTALYAARPDLSADDVITEYAATIGR